MSSWNEKKFSRNLGLIVFLIYFYGVAMGLLIGKDIIIAVPLSLLVVLVFVYAASNLGKSSFYRLKGMIGEAKIGVVLDQMWSDGVRYVGTVVLGKGDIDLVAINKSGVWTIESKHIDGSITCPNGVLMKDGKPFSEDFLSQAYAESIATKKYLDENGFKNVPVTPILVFSGPYAKVRFGLHPQKGVYVIGCLGIRKLFQSRESSSVLSPKEIERIYKLLSLKARNSE